MMFSGLDCFETDTDDSGPSNPQEVIREMIKLDFFQVAPTRDESMNDLDQIMS